jgi:hypothetical protein
MNLILKNSLFILVFSLFSTHIYAQLNALGAVQNTISSVQNLVAQTQSLISQIDSAEKKVKDNNLYKALVDGKEFTFPIGILPNNGDKNYAIVINKIFLTPDGMYAEVFLKVPVSSSKSLYFLADSVPYSHSGGFAGDLDLYLLKTDSVQIGKGYNIVFDGMDVGGTDTSCVITFNCKGFKNLTLTGKVNFDKRTIVKDQTSKAALSLGYYIQAAKASDFVLQLNNIPTFEFTNLPGFTVSIDTIIVDHSDSQNAPGFSLPTWYKDSIAAYTNLNPGDTTVQNNSSDSLDGPQWQGVYIPQINIDIPTAFKEKNPSQVVEINSENVIIDANGITALTSVKAVNGSSSSAQDTAIYSGTIKNWEYSIDSLQLNIIASSLSSAGIYGGITLPISQSGNQDQIAFGLLLSKSMGATDISYLGFIDISSTSGQAILNVQAFGLAQIILTNAEIDFNYANKQFSPSVNLTGSLNLTPVHSSDASATPAASFGLSFQGLIISTSAPYISLDVNGSVTMSSTGQMMSNFPVTIDSVGLIRQNGNQRLGLLLKLTVQIQKSGSGTGGGNGFGGTATFTIWTKRNPTTGSWAYDDFELDAINIYVNNSSFTLKGSLTSFQDDPVYGTGFCGQLSMTLMDGKLQIDVAGIFGRTDVIVPSLGTSIDTSALSDNGTSYRYWFVDAGITLPVVIEVTPFIGINGFSGGLYHHMQMDAPGSPSSSQQQTKLSCKSSSGMVYTPNSDIELGLLAGIGIQSVPTNAVYNGKITFAIEFNDNGGVNMFAFFGEVGFFTPPAESASPSSLSSSTTVVRTDSLTSKAPQIQSTQPSMDGASVMVQWFTEYDVPNKTFTGKFDVYVNVADVVQGSNGGFLAGEIDVLFSPSQQYIYIGTPTKPISLKVLDLFSCTSYFCAGNVLPNPPIAPLPSEFTPPQLNADALETGAGLSFGARVNINADFGGSTSFAGCSVGVDAKAWVDAGFDILITQTSQPVYCSSGARGIHNWYATGQAFVDAGISLGGHYSCLGASGNYTIGSASIAAYVFAQLPNPSYMIGSATVNFSLFSIVSGSATLNVHFGQQCADPDLDKNIAFIQSITPSNGSTNISVTNNIVVNFTKPIQTFQFYLPDESSTTGATLPYRALVSNSDVVVSANGNPISCNYLWNSDNTQLSLNPLSVLPENTAITVIVTVELQYEVSPGNWVSSSTVEGDTSVFTTMTEPITIQPSNIMYAYPMLGMQNYYKDESNSGYIRMFTLQRKPMQLPSGYSYNVVFYNGGTEVARVTNITVNNAPDTDQFTYTIPNNVFQDNTTYTLELVKAMTDSSQAMSKQQGNYTMGTYGTAPTDSTILSYTFTSSQFSSFAEKMAYYNQSIVSVSGTNVVNQLTPNQQDLNNGTAEPFTQLETTGASVNGIQVSSQLIRSLGADLSQSFTINSSVTNFPDSVSYSYYGGTLYVLYDVFNQLSTSNQENQSSAISCSVQQNSNNCVSANQASTFAKTTYYYKLGYYLPGKNIQTSSVQVGFMLPSAITIQ